MKTITYTTKINTPHDESRIAELIIDAQRGAAEVVLDG